MTRAQQGLRARALALAVVPAAGRPLPQLLAQPSPAASALEQSPNSGTLVGVAESLARLEHTMTLIADRHENVDALNARISDLMYAQQQAEVRRMVCLW